MARRLFARLFPARPAVELLEDRSAPTDLGLTAALLAAPAFAPPRPGNVSIAPPPIV